MPFDPLNPFPNTGFSTPFVFSEREKGFGERLVDDISNMSLKQTLGMPLSVPLQGGAGALKGASFGLLDFTDNAQDALGDFGLPDTVSSSLNIAGEIGGSFVPFIGASKVAHKLFQGLGLAADLARGATTFGAPELVRQALTQEFSPQAGARSLATGAAFALPLPRTIVGTTKLVGAVVGTELLFGADPLEATAAGLFAGLFGSISRKPRGLHAEVPPKIPSPNVKGGLGEFQAEFRKGAEVVGDSRGGSIFPGPGAAQGGRGGPAGIEGFAPGSTAPAGVFGAEASRVPVPPTHFTAGPKIAQDLVEPLPVPVKNVLREVMDDISLRQGAQTPAEKTMLRNLEKGQQQLFPAAGGGKTQVQIMNEAALVNSGTKLGENAAKLAKAVEAKAVSAAPAQLSLELDTLVRTVGPQAPETNIARWALAQAEGKFVPQGAPVTNELAKVPQLRGVNMVEQGPSNPLIVRAETQKLLTTLRGGPRAAQLKAQQIQDILQEARELVRRRGKELEPGKIAALTIKMEAALASKEVGIQTQDDAARLMQRMMGQHTTPEAVIALAKDPPPEILKAFPNGVKRFQQMAEDRAQVLKYVFEETGAKQFRPEVRRVSPGLDELRRKASDHGMQVTAIPRFTRKRDPFRGNAGNRTTSGREVIDDFQLSLGGQNVRKFKSLKAADAWVTALEEGKIDPTDIHELRALAHPRAIDVVYNGNGTVTLTNTMSGETFQGARNLKEATEVVRQAPNIASASREIGPPVPVGTHPPLSGTGSIGTMAAEQPPLADICGMPAFYKGV